MNQTAKDILLTIGGIVVVIMLLLFAGWCEVRISELENRSSKKTNIEKRLSDLEVKMEMFETIHLLRELKDTPGKRRPLPETRTPEEVQNDTAKRMFSDPKTRDPFLSR